MDIKIITSSTLQKTYHQVQAQLLYQENYENSIIKFSKTYRSLENMSITPKIHIVEHHIVDFLKMKHEEHGLGWQSEQAFEAMHSDMKKEWQKVQICDPDHPDFGQKLLEFVNRYNARHI